MKILLLIILLFNFLIANENNTTENNTTLDNNISNNSNEINIVLPEKIDEENVTSLDVENIEDEENEELKIAILMDEKKFFKYLPSLINSIDAYLLNKDINFKIKLFNVDKNLSSLNEISSKYQNIFVYSTTPKIVTILSKYPDNNFFLPIINKSQVVDNNISQNIFFGGLNFNQQIKKLANFVTDKSYIIKENNMLSNLTTNIEVEMLSNINNRVLKYPINYKYFSRRLNNSYVFVNTQVLHTAQILSNFTYYKIQPKLILSTQINYNPSIFSLTNSEDVKNFLVSNSLLLRDVKLLDINMNLGSDLKFNWLNYTTNVLLNKLYIDSIDEYPNFLNDFNLYIFNNQIVYKTKLYKIFNNGFIEVR